MTDFSHFKFPFKLNNSVNNGVSILNEKTRAHYFSGDLNYFSTLFFYTKKMYQLNKKYFDIPWEQVSFFTFERTLFLGRIYKKTGLVTPLDKNNKLLISH